MPTPEKPGTLRRLILVTHRSLLLGSGCRTVDFSATQAAFAPSHFSGWAERAAILLYLMRYYSYPLEKLRAGNQNLC